MRALFFVLLIILIFSPAVPLTGAGASEAGNAWAQMTWKILHIMSYHSPWKWTAEQLEGFKAALPGLNIEYTVVQPDMKRRTDAAWKKQVSRKARELINTRKPDLAVRNNVNKDF